MTVVGGNLADIGANEGSLRSTAEMAVRSGTATGAAAASLHGTIIEATSALVSEFERVAGELTADIERASRRLEATDWRGESRERAVQIQSSLTAQVHQVMATAREGLIAEQKAFCGRADALVADIEGRFKSVMARVEAEYSELGRAARSTAENLAAADQTIRMS